MSNQEISNAISSSILEAWFKSAARHEPRVDSNGEKVLYVGRKPIAIIVAFCLTFSAFTVWGVGVWGGLFRTDPNGVAHTIEFSCLFILPAVIYAFTLPWFITITPDGLTREFTWPFKLKNTIRWNDIIKVEYSTASGWFILRRNKGASLRVPAYMNGIADFVASLESKLLPEVYQRAVPMMDKISGYNCPTSIFGLNSFLGSLEEARTLPPTMTLPLNSASTITIKTSKIVGNKVVDKEIRGRILGFDEERGYKIELGDGKTFWMPKNFHINAKDIPWDKDTNT